MQFTRSRYEKKVVDFFTKKKIESYCPFNNRVRQWGSKKTTPTPVFPSFVFARMGEAQLLDVRKVEGVVNLAYWLNNPIVIRDIEIEMIKRFLEEHGNVQVEAIPVDPKAIVKVSYENLQSQDTIFDNVTSIKLLLPSLGRALIASTNAEQVKVITEYKFSNRFNLSF